MKRILLLLFLLTTTFGFTQVGVNTTNPDPSSMLDISATNKGVLVPRVSLPNVTTTMLDGTNTAATGLLIWNTNAATVGGNGVGFYFFNGAIWIPLTQAIVGNTLDQSYDQGGAGVGKNINATDGSVRINGDDGFLVTGTFGTGNTIDTEITGTGTRMFFNPRKAAFRAGQADATEWNNSNIGNYSIALGRSNTASNDYDIAIGIGSTASGSYSTALGWANTASGAYSFSMGQNSTASGFQSTVLGLLSTATNDNAMVFGNNSVASGNSSFALGNFSIASGLNSIAFGNNLTSKSGYESVFGIYNTDYTPVSVGGFNTADRLFVIGNGTNATNLSNALTIYKDGRMNINDAYTLPTTDGTNGQVMQTNGSGNVSWVTPASSSDHDIYEVGGTTAPDAITDNKYTQGTLTIGTNTAATGVLDVDNATRGTSVDINNTFATNPTGIDLNLTSNTAGKTGIKTQFNGTAATGNNSFIQNTDNMVGNTNRTAINNDFSGTSSSISTSITGLKNDFKSTSNYYAILYGVSNSFASTTNAWGYGMVNAFSNGGTTPSFGVVNAFNGTSTGSATGLSNSSNNYNGSVTGVDNSFSGTGNGIHYGVNNFLNGTGTGDKYGLYNFIATTAGGNHYGLYSNVLKPGSFAGYFQGAVSIGTTTTNTYILPPSRGTNGQIMQTDGLGNVTWVNPPTDTDDQTTDVFSLTGNTLNLSLQNDGVATQTVDLSSLKDTDWYEVGGTLPPNSITDNKYTQGSITIGTSTAATGVLDVDNSTKLTSIDVTNTYAVNPTGINIDINSTSSNKTGVNVLHSGTTTGFGGISSMLKTIDTSVGDFNRVGLYQGFAGESNNTSVDYTGVRNAFSADNFVGAMIGAANIDFSTSNGNRYGISNSFYGTGNGVNYGVYNYLSSTGTGAKYGVYNNILSTAGGTHYGIYSNVLKAGSYAGYFLGNVSIGTTAINNYILPASRGTNGQTMQTDGSGNVTWANPTDTDDQTTDVFSLTGTILNLSLQNDGVATQTVDLSSLKDDDWYEVGGTNSPDAITDNKFTLGDISIGKTTAAYGKFDVDAALKNVTTYFTNNNTTTGLKVGIQNSVTVNTNNNFSYGISNTITGNADYKYGIYNTLSGAVTGGTAEYGLVNYLNSSGAFNGFGLFNLFNPAASHTGYYTGLYNEVSGTNHTGGFIGLNNLAAQNTSSAIYGVNNSLGGTGLGIRIGVNNNMSGNSSGEVVGIETNISSTGTGNKYGERITILNSLAGSHYGVYSEVTKANSFAGYFLGNVSVGTNITNTYVLPPSRGLNGQIMQTDGSGNVSWVNNSASDADWYEVGGITPANSILDNIYTGGDVSIGKATAATGKVDIEADNKTSTLVLENNNATTSVKYGIDNNLTLNANNVFSAGLINKISGNAPFKFGVTNSFTTNNLVGSITEIGYNTDYTSTGNVDFIGHSNSIFPSSANSGSIIGYQNSVIGASTGIFTGFQNTHLITSNTTRTGLLNTIGGSGSGDIIGTNNSFSGSSNGEHIGTNTFISSFGTGLKYGEKIEIVNTSGGLHFGVYADVTKANSFAGYFLGRVSLGTTAANSYILPSSRGTLGQIMVTNGTGDVSWANPGIVFTDTDDQQIDVLSLTGNTLNLSLQNDGVATQTVDLSTLANDWKLTGNAGTTSGTNFIGTTDAQDLSFRTNNITKLTLTQRGQLSITNTGGSVLLGSGAGDADDFTTNQNTFIGTVSGESTSSGNLNSALGFNSLNANTLGLGNTAVGANALNVNVDGNNNTGLGRGANVSTTNLTNATAVGFNSTVNASNKIRLGNAAITVVEGQVAYTNPSDARFKFNVQENVPGLDFIKKLKPVTYNFDTKKFDEHLNKNRSKDEVTNEDFATSTAIIRTGFLAQDVEKICTDLGYNFDGLHIPDASNPTDNYGIAYSQFIMPIVKAVQEQQVIIETQKTELEQLKSELEKYKTLEERIKALEQK